MRKKGREERQISGQKLRFRPTELMISPLASKVNGHSETQDRCWILNLGRSCIETEIEGSIRGSLAVRFWIETLRLTKLCLSTSV